MASILPTGHQGEILSAPSPQPATAPVNIKTTNTSGSDNHMMVKGRCLELENYIHAGKCRKNRDNKVVLPSGSYIPQYPKKLYYKDRLEEWHRLNPGNLATGNLSANAAPDAQQQQVMNNMQAPVAATHSTGAKKSGSIHAHYQQKNRISSAGVVKAINASMQQQATSCRQSTDTTTQTTPNRIPSCQHTQISTQR
ncbi:hypothetical protein C0995_015858 [Termitomyces sp. Mi166|nr:hypothetical protein C0995_015858 [Termitomyces sp. Mi166\